MKLSDLLGAEVVDVDGVACGKVSDVRAVQAGPVTSPFGAALQIEGLVVGKGGLGERLGFHRSNVGGPWLLKSVFEWRERAARFVPWDDVAKVEPGRIHMTTRKADLGAVEKL